MLDMLELKCHGKREGGTYVTGITALLPLPPSVPPPGIVELGTGGVGVLKRDVLVDRSGMEVVGGLGRDDDEVTIPPPASDPLLPAGTTGGKVVGITIGPNPPPRELMVIDIPPPLGIPPAPPFTSKPSGLTQA